MAHILRDEPPVSYATTGPATFTFGAFLAAFYEACQKMWDAEPPDAPRCQPSVTLPDTLWPEVATLLNPVTGEHVPVQRVPMFAPVPRAAVKTATACPPSAEGGLCGCDEDDDTPPKVCLGRECDC